MLALMHNAGMAKEMHKQQRPTCGDAGGAFLYVRGDRLAVRTRGVHPRNVSSNLAPCTISGPVAVEAAASPCLQPRDCAPWHPTVANIAATARFFHSAAQSLNADCARHEYPSSRQAN